MTVAPADDLDEQAWLYVIEAIQDKLDNEVGFSQPTSKEIIDRVEVIQRMIKKLRKNYFVWNLLKGM